MEFKQIKSVKTNFVKKHIVYDIQLDKNHFFSANNIITHNCRLKNMISSKEFNFTNGNIGVN